MPSNLWFLGFSADTYRKVKNGSVSIDGSQFYSEELKPYNNQYVKLDLDLKFNTNGEEIGIYFDDKPEIYIKARKNRKTPLK